MASKKIQLYTDRDKTIEASPETSANCVILSDGNDLQKVLDNDLTSPTVVHEETSFKVGVGDINVSSSVVDGEVGRMVIKGQTYQNILPEPSTHVLTNNKEMFKVNEGLDPNVEIVDAVSKSAILKGQTLVNLIVDKSDYENKSGDININIIGNTVTANTNYTLLFDIDGDTSSTFTYGFLKGSQWLNGFHTTNVGKSKTLINTGNTTIDDTIKLRLRTSQSVVRRLVLLEGDYTNVDIPYFEGMQSVKMPVLTTSNFLKVLGNEEIVNIYNSMGYSNVHAELSENGKFILTGNGGWYSPNKVWRLEPNTTYTARIQGEVSFNKFYPNAISNVHHDSFDGGIYVKFTTDDTGDFGFLLTFTMSVEVDFNIFYGDVTSKLTEPHKTNILSCNEEVALRGIGDVQDTLNCNTGEYVQRFGEIVLDGTQGFTQDVTSGDFKRFTLHSSFVSNMKVRGAIMCDKFVQIPDANATQEGIATGGSENYRLMLWVESSRLSTPDVAGLQAWLQQNPVTVQYELTTPIVKTVDLSSSGNWEKRALDGTETNWRIHNAGIPTHTCFACELPNLLLQGMVICNEFKADNIWNVYEEKIMTHSTVRQLYLNLDNSRGITTVSKLKEYLSQNPITVWYQTTTNQDSTQVKQPIFFKDGHIQLSSGADNSLIPTLDYQAKTSNSYVMDLMKPNTIYTMKLKSGNGAFVAQGGQSIGFMVNRTFNSGNLPNDKLFYTTGWVDDLMILEGDLTSKTIPYFKGIKSAFEDEDEIEVLSTGKNLFDAYKYEFDVSSSRGLRVEVLSSNSIRTYCTDTIAWRSASVVYRLKPHTWYNIRCEASGNGVKQIDINIPEYGSSYNPNTINCTQSRNMLGKFLTDESGKVKLTFQGSGSESISYDNTYTNIQIEKIQEKSTVHSFYEPYKSNNTKIPLLSPLRSLPNGVCDELIIDRMKKKATLIQRVGVDIYNGSETWSCYNESSSKTVEGYYHTVQNLGGGGGNTNLLSNSFRANYRSIHNRDEEGVGSQQDAIYSNVRICISRTKLFPLGYTVGQNQVAYFQKWLQSNPVTVLYPLLTPVVTEIDLESFPLVYKDGHIFLNSEIAPMVEIDYNVNQAQQIQANNETLQRHELDILDLDNLIVSFVNAEYNLRLLKFDMELSMMALAE